MLDIIKLRKSFDLPKGQLEVLKGISLSLSQGESIALTGESGCGKSTLLHIIAGMEQADSGALLLNGTDLSDCSERAFAEIRREQMSIIFQQFNLITTLSVRDNIAFEARLCDRYDEGWTSLLIQKLGLEGLDNRYPEELSGGQQQRVAIARSLAAKPPLILADEPTGNLDEANSREVAKLLFDLVREAGASLLLVTHSDRLANMANKRHTLTRGRLQ